MISLLKYFALLLIIVIPLIGVWIWYTPAPEKVIEVNTVVAEKTAFENIPSESASGAETAEVNSYASCLQNGGSDITPDFTAPKVCVLDDVVYENSCVSNEKYFVMQDDTSTGFANIVIKRKQTPEQTFACEYVVAENDLELKSNGPDYLLALEGDYLLIDSGTGPGPRGLTVYDLITNENVFSDSYLRPISIKDGLVTYWTTSSIEATEENCPEYNEIRNYGLGAAIDERVSLDLLHLSKTELGEARCTARQ